MRIKLKDTVEVDFKEWHEHFKIFPRVVEGHLVFFEKVQRRLKHNWDYYKHGTYYWDYRLIERKEIDQGKT